MSEKLQHFRVVVAVDFDEDFQGLGEGFARLETTLLLRKNVAQVAKRRRMGVMVFTKLALGDVDGIAAETFGFVVLIPARVVVGTFQQFKHADEGVLWSAEVIHFSG